MLRLVKRILGFLKKSDIHEEFWTVVLEKSTEDKVTNKDVLRRVNG